MPVLAGDVAGFAFGWGGGENTAAAFAPTLALFGPALVFFTIHYFMLRGFYAMEMTRLVFFIQLAVSLTNIVVATVLVPNRPLEETAPMLVVAYLASYVVGRSRASSVLQRTVGGLEAPRLVRFLVRMALVLVAAGRAPGWWSWALAGLGERPGPLVALFRGRLSGLAGRDRPARRRARAAHPRGHDPGRHRRGAAAAGLRLLRVAAGTGARSHGVAARPGRFSTVRERR